MGLVHPLRQARLERGWTLDDVARRLVEVGREAGEDNLGATAHTVGRWERGEHQPGQPYPKLLCVLFQATASELGIIGDMRGFQKPEPCGTLDGDMDRREVLGLLSTALVAPVLLRGEAAADRLAYALAKPSRVDHEGASLVEAGIANARRLDDRFGSRAAIRPALAQRHVIRLLLQDGASGDVATRLTVAGAELDQFLGYLAWEIGDHATSRRYYGEALDLASQAGHEGLGAYVLGALSITVGVGRELWREMSRDALHEGLAFAQAGTSRAAIKGSAATRSRLAAVEAEALASLGLAAGAERALDRARAAFSRLRAEDEPPWMYWYDAAAIEEDVGTVYLALGRPEPARQSVEVSLETLDRSMVRERSRVLARLAETYVPDGEVDQACRVASQALTIATETRCDRAVLRVRRLRVQLEPWASEPMVRELDDQLASTASWAHSAASA